MNDIEREVQRKLELKAEAGRIFKNESAARKLLLENSWNEGLKRCRWLFEQLGVEQALNQVNVSYLKNMGKIDVSHIKGVGGSGYEQSYHEYNLVRSTGQLGWGSDKHWAQGSNAPHIRVYLTGTGPNYDHYNGEITAWSQRGRGESLERRFDISSKDNFIAYFTDIVINIIQSGDIKK